MTNRVEEEEESWDRALSGFDCSGVAGENRQRRGKPVSENHDDGI